MIWEIQVNLADTVETAFGAMPGGQFIMVPILDMIIHTWDLAKATGQNTSLDSGLCEFNHVVWTKPGDLKDTLAYRIAANTPGRNIR